MTGWGSVANPTRAGHNGHGQLQGQQALTGASVAAEQRDGLLGHQTLHQPLSRWHRLALERLGRKEPAFTPRRCELGETAVDAVDQVSVPDWANELDQTCRKVLTDALSSQGSCKIAGCRMFLAIGTGVFE